MNLISEVRRVENCLRVRGAKPNGVCSENSEVLGGAAGARAIRADRAVTGHKRWFLMKGSVT